MLSKSAPIVSLLGFTIFSVALPQSNTEPCAVTCGNGGDHRPLLSSTSHLNRPMTSTVGCCPAGTTCLLGGTTSPIDNPFGNPPTQSFTCCPIGDHCVSFSILMSPCRAQLTTCLPQGYSIVATSTRQNTITRE